MITSTSRSSRPDSPRASKPRCGGRGRRQAACWEQRPAARAQVNGSGPRSYDRACSARSVRSIAPTGPQGPEASMIKYIGSKRLLVPRIVRAILRDEPRTALDLFSGTSRVGHALKREGVRVHANDHNAYAYALAGCYVAA